MCAWATDRLPTIPSFVVGREFEHEIVLGDLRDPRRALLPVAAAVGEVVVPAAVFVLVTPTTGGDAARG